MKREVKPVAEEVLDEPEDEYECQFCRKLSPATKWKNNRCPKCKREYEEE